MVGLRRVSFARINRRAPTATLEPRPFRDDMVALAESRATHALIGDRDWIAAQMTLDPSGDFMTGVLGFEDVNMLRRFDPELWSWSKGEHYEIVGALDRQTLAPFAIDLRDERRWLAFAPTYRIHPPGFVFGFHATLSAAIAQLDLWPTEWGVELVLRQRAVRRWLDEHPDVVLVQITYRLHNPSDRIDDVRQDMRNWNATVASRAYRNDRRQTLNTYDNEEFDSSLADVEEGHSDVFIRSGHGRYKATFSSRNRSDEDFVSDFVTLEEGMDRMLDAVREYSEERAVQGRFDV